MKRLLLIFVLGVPLVMGMLPAAAQPDGAEVARADGSLAPLHEASGAVVEGSYIVVLEEGSDPSKIAEEMGVTPKFVYDEALVGFAAEIDEDTVEEIRTHPAVSYVEDDVLVEALGVQWNPPWGLDRIDQRFLPLDNLYRWTYDGSGINAYVFDTGIETNHWDFEGRARLFHDVFGGNGEDCNGHGTHVAGVIGGRNFGVAKKVNLWSVRVLDCNGAGTVSGIIDATNRVLAYGPRPGVANYSLGGPFSSALNAAVDALAASGVFVVAAAGSGSNACNLSPVSAAGAMGVGATNPSDVRILGDPASSCIEIWAPGQSIPSAWLSAQVNTISGTSPAAAHVSGTGVLVFSDPFATPSDPRSWITTHATTVTDPSGTFLLLYKSRL